MNTDVHSPEPWNIDEYDEIVDDNGLLVADTGLIDESRHNARRIVACVNALQGVPTELLEKAVQAGITDVSEGRLTALYIALRKEVNKTRQFLSIFNGGY